MYVVEVPQVSRVSDDINAAVPEVTVTVPPSRPGGGGHEEAGKTNTEGSTSVSSEKEKRGRF